MPYTDFQLPLRLSRSEQLDEEWIAQRIEEYVADYRQRGRTDRGRDIDTAFVRAALIRQGTLPS